MFYQYDASADSCPLPLVKLRCLLKKMSKQDSCVITLTDKGSKENIPQYLTKKGYRHELSWADKQTLIITIQGGEYSND